MSQNHYFLRFPEVKRKTGLSRSTIFRLERSGFFPQRRQISPKTIGWLSNEIDAWVASRVLANSEEAGRHA